MELVKCVFREAARFVDKEFDGKTKADKTALVIAYANTTALLRIDQAISALGHCLRTDQPLQGETLGGIESGLHAIAESLELLGAKDDGDDTSAAIERNL